MVAALKEYSPRHNKGRRIDVVLSLAMNILAAATDVLVLPTRSLQS